MSMWNIKEFTSRSLSFTEPSPNHLVMENKSVVFGICSATGTFMRVEITTYFDKVAATLGVANIFFVRNLSVNDITYPQSFVLDTQFPTRYLVQVLHQP